MAKCILRIYKQGSHEEENKPPNWPECTYAIYICEGINTRGKVVQLVVPPLITWHPSVVILLLFTHTHSFLLSFCLNRLLTAVSTGLNNGPGNPSGSSTRKPKKCGSYAFFLLREELSGKSSREMGARGDSGQQGCFHLYATFLAGGGHVERKEEEEAWLWQVPLSPWFPLFASSQRSKLEGDGVEKGSFAKGLNQGRNERAWNIKECCKP